MSEKKFTVGQSVWITRTYGKPERAVVTKVARKYAYIGEGFRQVAVDAETGREKSGFGRAYTLKEWSERQRLDELHAELRAHGIGPVGTSRFKQSVDALEAILAVLQRPDDLSSGGVL